MRCENIENLIADYADGELDGVKRDLVKAHIEECPHCAGLYREYLALNQALCACTERAPDDLCDKVMAAVQKERAAAAVKPMRGIRLGRVASFIGVGVAALLCISVVSVAMIKYMWQNGGAMESPKDPQEPAWTQEDSFAQEQDTAEDPSMDHVFPEEQGTPAPVDTDYEGTREDATEDLEDVSREEATQEEAEGTTPEETTPEETTDAPEDGGQHD